MSSGTLQLVCAAQLFRHMIEEGECAKVRGTSLISIVEFAQFPNVVVRTKFPLIFESCNVFE